MSKHFNNTLNINTKYTDTVGNLTQRNCTSLVSQMYKVDSTFSDDYTNHETENA